MKKGPLRNDDHWLAPHCLLILISHIPPNHLSIDGTTDSGLGPLTSFTNKENALQLGLMVAFCQLRLSLLSDDSSLSQVDMKLANTRAFGVNRMARLRVYLEFLREKFN